MITRVIDLTGEPPPGETTHWTAAAMAKATGISVSSVQRIWRSRKILAAVKRGRKVLDSIH